MGHERGNKVSVIDTGDANNPLGDSVQGTVTGSVRDLGFLKKPMDIVISSYPQSEPSFGPGPLGPALPSCPYSPKCLEGVFSASISTTVRRPRYSDGFGRF